LIFLLLGLAYEVFDLLRTQREYNASYISVFNIAWYALQPLPLGKSIFLFYVLLLFIIFLYSGDQSKKPSLEEDGIHFGEFKEGIPGIQPERVGPYCSTFNPGYDPNVYLLFIFLLFLILFSIYVLPCYLCFLINSFLFT
jgi:beta-galactosidase